MNPWRTTVAVSFLLAGLASVYALQSVFNRSDHEKGARIVRNFSAGGDTLEQVILARNPGSSLGWRTQVTSGCYGIVRVVAMVVPPNGAPPSEHSFTVDIPRLKVTALDPAAEADLAAVAASGRGARQAPPTTGPPAGGGGNAPAAAPEAPATPPAAPAPAPPPGGARP